MYAIVKTGGQQFRVEENTVIEVNKLRSSEGEEVVLDEVLLVGSDEGVKIGTPHVAGARVTAKVLNQFKGPKIDGFTYKPKKRIQRHWGHRQQLTRLKISKIEV
ncbi:MAG: 50S ribosomal protein L21 [Armatimonadetes bacterium]|nr:50S ribosomal protein L21 [Armatimonadota bacterium]